MTGPRFRITSHTADVRLHVWGDTEQELVAHAVAGAMRLALGRDAGGRATSWHVVQRDARDAASRLVAAVNEALFLLYTRHQVTVAVSRTGRRISLGVVGPAPGVRLEGEIKAATFHALRPRREGRRRSAVLVLDV